MEQIICKLSVKKVLPEHISYEISSTGFFSQDQILAHSYSDFGVFYIYKPKSETFPYCYRVCKCIKIIQLCCNLYFVALTCTLIREVSITFIEMLMSNIRSCL